MSAQVIQLTNRLADRYAKLMTIGFRPEDREQAIADYMDFAEQLVARGSLGHRDMQVMIDRKRESLIRQLQEINRI